MLYMHWLVYVAATEFVHANRHTTTDPSVPPNTRPVAFPLLCKVQMQYRANQCCAGRDADSASSFLGGYLVHAQIASATINDVMTCPDP